MAPSIARFTTVNPISGNANGYKVKYQSNLIEVVPEPGDYLMLLGGLGILYLPIRRSRERRRAKAGAV